MRMSNEKVYRRTTLGGLGDMTDGTIDTTAYDTTLPEAPAVTPDTSPSVWSQIQAFSSNLATTAKSVQTDIATVAPPSAPASAPSVISRMMPTTATTKAIAGLSLPVLGIGAFLLYKFMKK